MRAGDTETQEFAVDLGCTWAGSTRSGRRRARRGDPVRASRRARACGPGAVRKGGTVVCGGIHMSDIPTFP